jgi:predicted nuclease with TOPRIM domain
METYKVKATYEAWLSTEFMHKGSLKWLSELKFAKDEELFLNDLIKSYTLQLIDSKYFNKSKEIVDRLKEVQKETITLIEIVQAHENNLKIMVDGLNQIPEENAYKKEHGKLIITIYDFLKKYRKLKSQLFSLVKSIIKESKQKRLLPKN